MDFKENADVLNAKGEKMGTIDRVVIDPQTRTVTHLVVQKGLLFTREKVIPIEMLDRVTPEEVTLKNIVDPDELPDFEEEYHIPAEQQGEREDLRPGYARPLMWYPHPGVPSWGMGTYPMGHAPHTFVRTKRNIPKGTVPLAEGAGVICRDGEKAGRIERIFSEPEEHRATHLVISSGLISKKKKLVPSIWIDRIEEDAVHLKVGCDVIDGLPPFSE
jgi:uncharacterized protein YrrD